MGHRQDPLDPPCYVPKYSIQYGWYGIQYGKYGYGGGTIPIPRYVPGSDQNWRSDDFTIFINSIRQAISNLNAPREGTIDVDVLSYWDNLLASLRDEETLMTRMKTLNAPMNLFF